jgi:hypothetical protein
MQSAKVHHESLLLSLSLVILLATSLLQVHAAGQRLLVSNLADSSVLEFDGSTGAFVGVFVAPGSGGLNNVQCLTFGPDGRPDA